MPLDYNAATYPSSSSSGDVNIDRTTVVAAVERYLAARGMAVTSGPSCGCDTKPTPAPAPASSSASVVDRFLARRADAPTGGYG
jgi:hypothetical protein